jgi:hypothetical protein
MKRANIDTEARRLTAHSFRHSLNTILRDQGVPAEKIRAAMGWTNEKTQDSYTHFGTEHLRAQADLVDGLLGGNGWTWRKRTRLSLATRLITNPLLILARTFQYAAPGSGAFQRNSGKPLSSDQAETLPRIDEKIIDVTKKPCPDHIPEEALRSNPDWEALRDLAK